MVISQRLVVFAEPANTISNTASLTYEEDGQAKSAQSNTVMTEVLVSPSASPIVTLTPTPTPTPTVVSGGGGGYWYDYKMALAAKLAAAKKALINAKLLLIMKLKGAQNKQGAPTIDYVNVSPNPARVGQEIKFEVGWSSPTNQAKIYVCRANLLFNRACAKAKWCEYGPKNSSPAWCFYTPQVKDNYFNYFYIYVCTEDGKCSLGQGGNFRVYRALKNY